MNRPSFQFYPADWRGNAKLRRCSIAARGAWLEVICLLHDSDEYGVLRWPLAEIAHAAGLPLKLLRELVDKAVLKGDDALAKDFTFAPSHAGKTGPEVVLVKADGGPCWYCSRLVRDEWVRQRRGLTTRFKAAPNPQPNPEPKGGIGGGFGGGFGDGPSSSSSSSVKPSRRKRASGGGEGYPPDFEALWHEYPKREGGNSKADAFAKYRVRTRQGVPPEEMLAGVKRYALFMRSTGKEGTPFVMQTERFLGTGLHFRDAWTPAAAGPSAADGIEEGAIL